MFVKAVNRTSEAIEELLAQQRLDGTPGLEVRLSPQNQVFLNTWRPTRAAIPASLMEKLIPGFKARAPAFLTIAFLDKGIRTYHWYSGGKTWVPIVPGSVAHPNDVLHIAIEPLSPQTFLERFPALMLSNEPYLMRNMPDETLLRIRGNGTNFDVIGEQWPAINGLNDFEVRCVATGGLIHQTGSTILPFAIEDAFSVRRQMRLYHNGHNSAKLALLCAGDYFRVIHVSCDGFKVRFVYEFAPREHASTSVYLKRPALLYRLGDMVEIPNPFSFNGIRRLFSVAQVEILRDYERAMVERGRNYTAGRIGAEIAYTVITEKFGRRDLVLEEPGRTGKDLYSIDRSVVVQARLARRIPPSMDWLVEKEMMQMSGKLQSDFRWTKEAKVGYAVLSFYQFGRIRSLIAEVARR